MIRFVLLRENIASGHRVGKKVFCIKNKKMRLIRCLIQRALLVRFSYHQIGQSHRWEIKS